MDPYLPVLFALIGAICLGYYLLWSIPLVIRVLVQRYGGHALVVVQVGWCLMGMRVTYAGGELLFSLVLREKPVYTRPFPAIALKFAPGIPREEPEPERERERERRQPQDIFRTIDLLLRLWRRAGKLLRATRRAVSLQSLDCEATVGLSGAAETGRFLGIYSALRPFLFIVPNTSITVTPVFTHPVLEGKSDCRIRVSRPLTLALLGIGLVLTPEFLELVATFRQGRSE
jgi:hypothetical protein